jgi:hypothetical protein
MQDTTQSDRPHASDGSDTDINAHDTMSTSSSDASYTPSRTPTDDDFSADTDDNLSVIYSDLDHPPHQLALPGLFDILDYEAILSQQAFVHYQNISEHVSTNLPQREEEFTRLLTHAVRTNQDPVDLDTLVQGWLPVRHP